MGPVAYEAIVKLGTKGGWEDLMPQGKKTTKSPKDSVPAKTDRKAPKPKKGGEQATEAKRELPDDTGMEGKEEETTSNLRRRPRSGRNRPERQPDRKERRLWCIRAILNCQIRQRSNPSGNAESGELGLLQGHVVSRGSLKKPSEASVAVRPYITCDDESVG